MTRTRGEGGLHGRRTTAGGAARMMALGIVIAASASPARGAQQTDPTQPKATQADSKTPAAPPAKPAAAVHPYRPDRFAQKAGRYYKLVWGVDSLTVKLAESGELVRFSWRVLDPEKAKALGDKKLDPALVDPQAGVSLVVPVMEKIGQLRQGVAPEAGKTYWMAFSNKGRLVKRGARVNVVIGEFRADGLVVD